MTQALDSLSEVADRFGAIVLDQWGVLHDGSAPYPGTVEAVSRLAAAGVRLAVLSNSGKRSAPNADRIARIGFDPAAFEFVMTSGEALWQDVAAGRVPFRRVFPLCRAQGDAEAWAEGLDISFVETVSEADAVLLMGLPDGSTLAHWDQTMGEIRRLERPVLCTNPDRASPRAGGETVVSPGALAHALHDAGAEVSFYGKPHAPVFRALETALDLPPDRLLMVGDSLEHDIAGAAGAGWSSLFIRGGLYAAEFSGPDVQTQVLDLARKAAAPAPTYTLEHLS